MSMLARFTDVKTIRSLNSEEMYELLTDMSDQDSNRLNHVISQCALMQRGNWKGPLGSLAQRSTRGVTEYLSLDWECTTTLAQSCEITHGEQR